MAKLLSTLRATERTDTVGFLAPSTKRTEIGVVPPEAYARSGEAWVSARRKVGAELQKLEQAILEAYREPALAEAVGKSVRKLDRVLELFDAQVADALGEAARSTDAAQIRRWHDEARQAIARYQGYLDSDPLVQELDDNPFVPVEVRSTLSATLGALAGRLR